MKILERLRRPRTARRKKILLIVTALGIAFLLAISSQVIANQLTGAVSTDFVGLKPVAHGLGYNNASVLGIPLNRLASGSRGETLGPQLDSQGHYVPSYEDGRILLVLYSGKFPNGTSVSAVTVTNLGTTDVTISSLDLFGDNPSSPLAGSVQSEIIGCAHSYTQPGLNTTSFQNGTTIVQTVTYTISCGNPALYDALTLRPGQSFSGYIIGNFFAGPISINTFSAGVEYTSIGSDRGYVIQVKQP